MQAYSMYYQQANHTIVHMVPLKGNSTLTHILSSIVKHVRSFTLTEQLVVPCTKSNISANHQAWSTELAQFT